MLKKNKKKNILCLSHIKQELKLASFGMTRLLTSEKQNSFFRSLQIEFGPQINEKEEKLRHLTF